MSHWIVEHGCLTLCMLGIFHAFVYFQNIFFSKILSQTLSECLNKLEPDQDRHSVGPDLGQNCLQRYPQTRKVAANKKKS